jgi:hypothetical protein
MMGSQLTLLLLPRAGFGCEFDAIRNPGNPLTQAYNTVFSPSREARFLQTLSIVLHPLIVQWLPVKRNSDVSKRSRRSNPLRKLSYLPSRTTVEGTY